MQQALKHPLFLENHHFCSNFARAIISEIRHGAHKRQSQFGHQMTRYQTTKQQT